MQMSTDTLEDLKNYIKDSTYLRDQTTMDCSPIGCKTSAAETDTETDENRQMCTSYIVRVIVDINVQYCMGDYTFQYHHYTFL